MPGLTTLGIIHTAIGLVALACGFWSFARDKEISPFNGTGSTHLVMTFLTAASGLGIFQHGGIGITLQLRWLHGKTSRPLAPAA